MSPKYVFWGSVIVVAAVFSVIYATLGNYLLAVLAFGLGVMWLAVDVRIENHLTTLFFLMFVALAMIASLNDGFIPLTVLGMSANLAAWDMARFMARLAGENAKDTRTVLETRHLHLLLVIIGSGFLVALLPLFLHLELPFVIVCGVALLTLMTLRQSMHSLWTDRDRGG